AWLDVAAGLLDVCLALRRVAGLGLNLLLNFAPETVGVREADLNFRLRAARVVVMSFARERRRERRLTAAAPTVAALNGARRGLAEQGSGLAVRIGDEALQRSRRQVGVKIFEQVAEVLNLFPSHRSSHDHPQRAKLGLGTIAVRVGDKFGLKRSVIELGGN